MGVREVEIDGCDRFHDSALNESRLAVRLGRNPELDSQRSGT